MSENDRVMYLALISIAGAVIICIVLLAVGYV